ncbi:hypothetical protein BOTBODRAFT_182420 [Botryobasidium botryosum FD-172 SS1]|uniref:Transposase domain-containing protein n=1 Tax=Botryobasidium botryosum (strain FD-172 SS1) TaxID=930990 RepID=A0A067LRE5_BOTB1|nr:hypothetical protein BOTBODRAFT_182420 [Botryobasidium botryosum FD-172 SS1]
MRPRGAAGPSKIPRVDAGPPPASIVPQLLPSSSTAPPPLPSSSLVPSETPFPSPLPPLSALPSPFISDKYMELDEQRDHSPSPPPADVEMRDYSLPPQTPDVSTIGLPFPTPEIAPIDLSRLYDDSDDEFIMNPLAHPPQEQEQEQEQEQPASRPGDESEDPPPTSTPARPKYVPAPLPPRTKTEDLYTASSSYWFVRLAMLITAFLHTQYQLPFRACALLLFVLRCIFLGAGLISDSEDMPIKLDTALNRLGLEPRFTIYPLCRRCHRFVQNPKATLKEQCLSCEEVIFSPPPPGSKKPKPKLAAPFSPLSHLLVDFLQREGMEQELDRWRTKGSTPGKLDSVMCGDVWKTIKGADGQPFFGPDYGDELRIGVTLSLDWFSVHRSSFAESHSSGAYSFCIANLFPELRYRPKNLLLSGMTPGPKEPTAEQLQEYLILLVDDLIMLLEQGVMIRTPLHPEGRLVRAVLIGIICDHPAMCKMSGFADKGHLSVPCTYCKVTKDDLKSDAGLSNGFPARDGDEHKRRVFEYRDLKTAAERKAHFAKHGAHWAEVCRLPYFDPVRMTIIDPMHNLLLGIVKDHWYKEWICRSALRGDTKTGVKRELDHTHQILSSMEIPPWNSRLPSKLGEPAGGSLGADEWKLLATVFGPIAVPLVWDKWYAVQQATIGKQQETYQKKLKKYNDYHEKLAKEKAAADHAPAPPSTSSTSASHQTDLTPSSAPPKKTKKPPPLPTKPSETGPMQEDEPGVFLLLSAALNILLATSITEAQIDVAQGYLFDYLKGFKRLYGEGALHPNHHWATHIGAQIRNYGPVYGFWCFLTERLNKILKSYNLNNQNGGELEITMMRALGRDSQILDLLRMVSSQSTEGEFTRSAAHRLLDVTGPTRGTIETVADLLDHDDISNSLIPGAGCVRGMLPPVVRAVLVHRYNQDPQLPRVFNHMDRDIPQGGIYIVGGCLFYKSYIIHGRTIVPVNRALRKSAVSALVRVRWNQQLWYGEVLEILTHEQPNREAQTMAHMRWMKRSKSLVHRTLEWNKFRPYLDINVFHANTYAELEDDCPPDAIPLTQIESPLARVTEGNNWITFSLSSHCVSPWNFS